MFSLMWRKSANSNILAWIPLSSGGWISVLKSKEEISLNLMGKLDRMFSLNWNQPKTDGMIHKFLYNIALKCSHDLGSPNFSVLFCLVSCFDCFSWFLSFFYWFFFIHLFSLFLCILFFNFVYDFSCFTKSIQIAANVCKWIL